MKIFKQVYIAIPLCILVAGCASNKIYNKHPNISFSQTSIITPKISHASLKLIHAYKASGEFGYIGIKSFTFNFNLIYNKNNTYLFNLDSIFLLHKFSINKINSQLYKINAFNGQSISTDNLKVYLQKELKMSIPTKYITNWVLGVPTGGTNIKYNSNLNVSSFTYNNWTIKYSPYKVIKNIYLPNLINISTKGISIKMKINSWKINK
ncbi:MAG: lipoprotein insertase outer membrane protein LolB [Psittacicella sp.]